MKKTIGLFAALIAISSVSAFAAQNAVSTVDADEAVGVVYDANSTEVNLEHGWEFLGCFNESHECRRHAEHHGFRFHMTEVNHARCGHHALACYGRR